MNIRHLALFLPLLLLAGSSQTLSAQVKPSAFISPVSLTIGGTASVFAPDYIDYKLGGIGAFVDLNIWHGVGVEAEGRWQRFHEYAGISQDNYLIGPRVKLHPLWKAHPYVKVLGGFSNMTFGHYGYYQGTGSFSTIAFGGGVDFKVTRRVAIRAFDAEYQYWPDFLGTSLQPYGYSAGVSYRIF